MKYAFSAPTSTSEERESLFSHYSSAGYDGLQLKKAQFQDFVDAPGKFVDRWGDCPGIASGLIVGGGLDQPGIDALRSAIQFASRVHSDRIVFCHSLPRSAVSTEDISRFGRILSALGTEARDVGVVLSLHHHYNQPVMYRHDFDLFFDAVQDRAIGLTIDTAHLVKSGIDDIAEVIRAFHQVIDNFHMKDFADGEFRVLGQGAIDFGPVFAAIEDTGFNGWLCADEESGGDISQTLSECFKFLRKGTADA